MHNNVPFVFLWVLFAAAPRRIVDIHCHFTSLLEMLLLRVICWESYHKHHLLAMMVFSREKPWAKSFTLTIDLNILTSCDHSHWSSNIHPCLDVPPWHLELVSCTHPHECDTWALWEKDSSLTPATLEHDILIMQVLVRMRWWSNGQSKWADFNWFLPGALKNGPRPWHSVTTATTKQGDDTCSCCWRRSPDHPRSLKSSVHKLVWSSSAISTISRGPSLLGSTVSSCSIFHQNSRIEHFGEIQDSTNNKKQLVRDFTFQGGMNHQQSNRS